MDLRAAGLCAGFATSLLTGCFDISFGGSGGGKGPSSSPGEIDMGAYQAAAAESGSSCGSGALGAPPSYEFLVELSRSSLTLFWHSGDSYAAGQMDDDGAFHFETVTSTNMRDETQGWMPACSIRRTDVADAEFDNPRLPRSFSGKMTYSFTPEAGSDCIDLVTGEGAAPDSVPLFATLPCEIAYHVEAKRTDVEADVE